jgi:site-specific DNA-methyltransferase (adenine-specific)
VRYRVMRRNPRLAPGCTCGGGTRPGVVLDPFLGTGTVGAVAQRLGRDWLGIELSPTYAAVAARRLFSVPIKTGRAA